MRQDCAVIVFAKAPVPGQVKTRLAAAIGDEAAAHMAALMLDETLKQAVAAGIGPVELCCAPDCEHPVFLDARGRYGITLTRQKEGNLGARMREALERALCTYPRALLIGTDCLQRDRTHLQEAAKMLLDRQAVFIPTFDGGYALVGLSKMISEIFEGVDWSTDRVMRQTQARLDRFGIATAVLAPLADIDDPRDLELVPEAWWNEIEVGVLRRTVR